MLSAKPILVSSCLLFLLTACSSGSTPSVPPGSVTGASLPRVAENSGQHCEGPRLQSFGQLSGVPELPDPFLGLNGKRIHHKSDWICRRAEIGAQVQQYELGVKPPAPDDVRGEVTAEQVRVQLHHQGQQIAFDARIQLPAQGTPPYPAVIALGRSFLDNQSLSDLGVAVIEFPNNELAEQLNTGSRGKGKFYELYGSDHSASAMMAWAWGISRLIDVLEDADGNLIDAQRLGVTGCSRNGKGAVVAGAFDERIALTLVQESGSGGAASWRISDAQREAGQNVQTLRQIVTENVWFREDFAQFAEAAEKLPFDHHAVMGMIAPRALLVVENGGIDWLGNQSTYVTSLVAREIWASHGIADHMGVSQQSGHNHCQLPDGQTQEVAAFVRRFLLNEHQVATDVVRTDADFPVDLPRWMPWRAPRLE